RPYAPRQRVYFGVALYQLSVDKADLKLDILLGYKVMTIIDSDEFRYFKSGLERNSPCLLYYLIIAVRRMRTATTHFCLRRILLKAWPVSHFDVAEYQFHQICCPKHREEPPIDFFLQCVKPVILRP